MRGRFTRELTWQEVVAFSRLLSILTPDEDPEPAYNIAPTDPGPVVVASEGGGEVQSMRWGLMLPVRRTRQAETQGSDESEK